MIILGGIEETIDATATNNILSFTAVSSINSLITLSSQPFLFLDNVEAKEVRVGDIDIAYKIFGKGKLLLLIPGFSMTIEMWDPSMLSRLSLNHTIVIFDNRGIGHTQLLAMIPNDSPYRNLQKTQ